MRPVLVAVLALWVAPAAFAESHLGRTGARNAFNTPPAFTLAAGPSLAGDEVLWAEHRGKTFAVVADGPRGRRTVGEYPASPSQFFAVDAAEGRVALGSYFMTCGGSESCSKYMGHYAAGMALRSGPVAGPLTDGRAPCVPAGLSVAAGALAVRCSHGEAIVTTPDGTQRRTHRDVRLAGSYVADRETKGEETVAVVLKRLDSGEEVLRIEAPARGFDLAADGTLAAALPDGRVSVASPQRREPRTVAAPFDVDDVRVAGGRLAVRARNAPRFAVLERDGRVVGEHAASAAEPGWDFDGSRVAWLAHPCSLVTVAVWEAGSEPPPSVGERCATPQIATARTTVTRGLRFALPLRCPPEALAGCAGRLSIAVRGVTPGGRAIERQLPLVVFDLDPGTLARRSIPIYARDVRRFRRYRRVRLDVRIAVAGPTYEPGPAIVVPLRLPRR